MQVSPPSGGFCFLYDAPISRGTPRTFNVQPFPHIYRVLWPRLTSDKQTLYRYRLSLLRDALLPPSTVYQTSPGKNANFLPIYLSDIHPHPLDSFGLRFVQQTRPDVTASSASCSSGRRFTAGFLQIRSRPRHPCLGLTLPTIKARSGLPPYSLRPCRAHTKKRAIIHCPLLFIIAF